jgi:hypothetical protein
VTVDPDLVAAAKREIARQHGLDPDRAHRLVGSTASELHADAESMAREDGVHDPTTVQRDEGGRFAARSVERGDRSFDLNAAIREAAGRR